MSRCRTCINIEQTIFDAKSDIRAALRLIEHHGSGVPVSAAKTKLKQKKAIIVDQKERLTLHKEEAHS